MESAQAPDLGFSKNSLPDSDKSQFLAGADRLTLVVKDRVSPAIQIQATLYQEPASATTIQLVSHQQLRFILKRVAKNRLFSVEQQESARRELEIHSSLSHQNIVTLLAAEETSTEYLYLLEYLPHASYFTDKLETNNKPMMLKPAGDIQKLRSFAFDILSGLEFLHSSGIVHMDIKPANLLLSEDVRPDEFPRVKICDFGLARRLLANQYVVIPLRCGTEAYMAPEVVDGGVVTPAADMWSFGIFLHVLVFGYAPAALKWKRGTPLPKVTRHWRKYENTSLFELLSECLHLNPEQRIPARLALTHAFFLVNN